MGDVDIPAVKGGQAILKADVYKRQVYGRSVRVGGISGVIGGKATHLCSADEKKQVPKPSELLIDIGAASKEEAEALVRPGDTAV